jgi:hypothetical protein
MHRSPLCGWLVAAAFNRAVVTAACPIDDASMTRAPRRVKGVASASDCAPIPELRLMRLLQARVEGARKQLG